MFSWHLSKLRHLACPCWTRLSDFTFTFHFHALEKEMATHSSVLAWRIPGTGEPGGLPVYGVAQNRTRLKWVGGGSSSSLFIMSDHSEQIKTIWYFDYQSSIFLALLFRPLNNTIDTFFKFQFSSVAQSCPTLHDFFTLPPHKNFSTKF